MNHADLVVLNEKGKTFSILLNNGGGGFPSRTDYSLLDSGTPSAVCVVDVNDDDYNDLVITLFDKNKAEIWTNNGFGVFTSQGTFDTGNLPEYIYAVDLTYDGLKDILIAHGSCAFRAYINNGDGTFTYKDVNNNFAAQKSASGSFFVTDVDGDEDYDAIVPVSGDYLTLFLNSDTDQQGNAKFSGEHSILTAGLQISSIHGTNHNKPRFWSLGG